MKGDGAIIAMLEIISSFLKSKVKAKPKIKGNGSH